MNELSRCNLIGTSARFQQTCAQMQTIASVDAAILIAGETGTGKALAARAIHYQSSRVGKPFIPVNCATLPEALIESELFGHERGAFADAKAAAPGLVCEADGGTLFLVDIEALSLKAQAAVLRFLQDRTYRRVGSEIARQADVRIIAASHANLEQLVETRQFRSDLLCRINALMLCMPPLREREADALALAQRFLTHISHQYRLPSKTLSADACAFITQYGWPGNIRELENVIHRQFLLSDGPDIHLGIQHVQDNFDAVDMSAFTAAQARATAEFERRYLHKAVEQATA